MQLTKFLLETKTDTGDDVVIDFMQIIRYSPVVKDGVHLMHVYTADSADFYIQASVLDMKHFAGKVGVPIYAVSTIGQVAHRS